MFASQITDYPEILFTIKKDEAVDDGFIFEEIKVVAYPISDSIYISQFEDKSENLIAMSSRQARDLIDRLERALASM